MQISEATCSVRAAVVLALWIPSWVLTKTFFPMNEFGKPLLVSGAVTACFYWVSFVVRFSKRATRRRHNHVEALTTATRLGEIVSAQAQRLLIIRAIDDEASLILALSTIVNFFHNKGDKVRTLDYSRTHLRHTIVGIIVGTSTYHSKTKTCSKRADEDAIQVSAVP